MIFSFNKKRIVTFLALLGIHLAIFSMVTAPAVVIDIEPSVSLPLNVFYYNGAETGYPFDDAHLTKSVSLTAAQRQTVRFPLSRKDMSLLRFDFGTEPAAVTVYEIALQCSPFEQYHFVGPAITQAFPTLNCIDSVSEENGAVTYVTTGVDGFIAAGSNLFAAGGAPGISLPALGAFLAGLLLAFLIGFTRIPQLVIHCIFTTFSTLSEGLHKTFPILVERIPHIRQWAVCALVTLLCLSSIWAGPQYILLNLAYSFGLGLCVSVVWEKVCGLRHEERRDLLVLTVVTVIATLPLMLTPFYYGDDYWGFKPVTAGYDYAGGISFRRPLLGPMSQMLRSLDYRQLHLRRAGMVLILILSTILIYELILRCHKSRKWAFSVSLLFAAGTSVIDAVAYISTSPILWGILFSLCAFEYYERAQEESRWNYLIFALLLLCGFYFYQIATPVLFVAFLITLYNNKEKESQQFKKAFKILTLYGVIAVGYLLSTKLLTAFYQIAVTQTERSKISIDPAFYSAKAEWFWRTVIPQSIYKSWAVLLGNDKFSTNNLFYTVKLNSRHLEVFITIVTLIGIGVYLLRFLLHRRYATLFVSLVGIPLSFYPFLILPESTALSYYMIPLILLLTYYTVSGFWILWDRALAYWPALRNTGRRVLSAACAAAVILTAAGGSVYANNWVNFSRDSYMFLKQSIIQEINEDTKTIMVFGTLGPYVGGNPYVVFAVQRILDEAGKDPAQYNILQADNADYITTLPEYKMKKNIQSQLTPEEFERFQSFYTFDTMYGQYWYTHSADKEDLEFLRQCLQKAELVVLEPSETEIVISLGGFAKTHIW